MKAIFNTNVNTKAIFFAILILAGSNSKGQIEKDSCLLGEKKEERSIETKIEEINYIVFTGALIRQSANASNEVILYEKSPNIEGFPQYRNTGNLETDIKNYTLRKIEWISKFKPELENMVRNEIKLPMTIKKTSYHVK